jgi:hypothetical protein
MYWDNFQTAAMRAGWLIFAMSQDQIDLKNMVGPWGGETADGYCVGFAACWIALRYGGSDYAFDSKTRVVEMPDFRAIHDQIIYQDTARTGAFPDDFAPAFANFELTLNKGTVTTLNSAATGSFLRAAGSAGMGCYFVTLYGHNTGHAVAIQNEGRGNWRFFDSNYGCFRANSDRDFEKFVDWFMEETTYKFPMTYGVATKIVGVNPPPYVSAAFDSRVNDLIKIFAA